ncbi:collagenase [Streptosporangium sp. NPDC000396]|uniref:collagenase n=1 Tax=Streptosporangium sp. NPDC000396 TaxID=3366185 RepID=UPI0036D14B36
MTSPLRRSLAKTLLLVATLGIGLGTQTVLAVPGAAAAPRPDREVSGSSTAEPPHLQRERLPAQDRAPLPASDEALKRDYDAPRQEAKPAAKAAAACNVGDFTSRTGSALVAAIKASTTECVNTLFSLTGNDAYLAFREAQMVSVAYGLRDNSLTYTGDNSAGTAQLVLYLRAGYYVQWNNSSTVGPYGAPLETAIRAALDAFFASGHSGDVNDANGEILSEAVILIDSAEENARYLYVVKRLLNAYTNAYNQFWYMRNAVNNVYTVLFRGHQMPDFVTAVTSDPSVLDTLYGFAVNHLDLLGTGNGFLTANAGRELSRFLRHDALKAKTRPLARGLLDRSSITGPTARLWMGVAEMADAYDQANCSYFGTCDLQNRIKAAVLPIRHTCSSTLRIVAQEMTSPQLTSTCTSLSNQDAYFHGIVKDNGPVANDRNTTLEVVVFDSSADYQTYAGPLYGIDTNNGGMYLEGNPQAAGNQPRFIAYEAEWLRPVFAIWNLNHEYTHYLDGRFDMYGDFAAGTSTPTIWWVEGFAEFVSYSYRREVYQAAITEAAKKTYTLRQLFDTTYDHDTTRIYRWGYLAVRYMLERHPADVTTILGHYRTGNWNAARSFVTGLNYNSDWNTWLTACAAGACGGGTPNNQAPTAAFTFAVNGSTVSFTDGSTDADGTVAARAWDFGDGTTSTATNPTKTYTATGTYTARLTVTDDKGATGTITKSVTVSGYPECSEPDVRQLGKNCRRSNISAAAGDLAYRYIYIPAGTAQLRITTSGGTGNADLYYSPSSWATTTNYTARSATSGNAETLTVTNPAAGYHYISLHAATAFGGVTITTEH